MFCVQEAGIGGAWGRNDPVCALWPGRGDVAAFEVRVHQLEQHSAWPCAARSSVSRVARGQREACSVAGWRSCCPVQICLAWRQLLVFSGLSRSCQVRDTLEPIDLILTRGCVSHLFLAGHKY